MLWCIRQIALAIDMVLKPLGLILWLTYDFNEETGAVKVVAAKIGRRPVI